MEVNIGYWPYLLQVFIICCIFHNVGKSKGSIKKNRKDGNSRDKGNQILETNGGPGRNEGHHTSMVDDHSEGSMYQ